MNSIEYVTSFEEVDFALKQHLSGCVIDGKEIDPIYYTPDVDLVKVDLPSIVFYRNQPFRDNSRWKQDEVRDNFVYDDSGNLIQIDLRNPPEPWSILYVVRTMYKYQQDGVELNRFLFKKFPRGSCIVIKGVEYDVELVSSNLGGSQYKDFGRVEGGTRRFYETYTFRVDILLDIYDRKTVKTVQQVIVNTTTNP